MSDSVRPHRQQPTRLPPSLGFSRQEHWSGLPFPPPMHESEKWKWSRSVGSDSSRPHGLQPTRLLHPWDFPGKSTGVGCHCLLQNNTLEGISSRIIETEEPGRLQAMGSRRVGQTERLHFHFSLSCIAEGNGNPLQCYCLENPKDGGVWWAAVYGVTELDTTEVS